MSRVSYLSNENPEKIFFENFSKNFFFQKFSKNFLNIFFFKFCTTVIKENLLLIWYLNCCPGPSNSLRQDEIRCCLGCANGGAAAMVAVVTVVAGEKFQNFSKFFF